MIKIELSKVEDKNISLGEICFELKRKKNFYKYEKW